jgi:hypothetical protein
MHFKQGKCRWPYIRAKNHSTQPNINNAEMVDAQTEETMTKTQAVIVYKFTMVQEILLISNDHTTPYPESQGGKKKETFFYF